MDKDQDQNDEAPAIPVLQDIVEIRVGAEDRRMTVPVDLEQLTLRITDEVVRQLQKELAQQIETCLDQALEAAMAKVRHEVQKVLLAQLAPPDS